MAPESPALSTGSPSSYGILKKGGFDVIIGNPPWKEISTLKGEYGIRNYKVEKSGNLYAVCSERSFELLAPGVASVL